MNFLTINPFKLILQLLDFHINLSMWIKFDNHVHFIAFISLILRKLRSKPNTENHLFSMVCALLVIYFPSNKALCTELYILYISVADIMFHMLYLKIFWPFPFPNSTVFHIRKWEHATLFFFSGGSNWNSTWIMFSSCEFLELPILSSWI